MTAVSAPPALNPRDFLAIDRQLSDEERDIRDTVRAFVDDKVTPNVGDWFEAGTIPIELARELGQLGVLGMHLEGYGCAGASATAYGLTCMELEAGDSGIRCLVSVQGSLAMFAIWRWGSEEQKQQWLPQMAAGDAIGCFGLTEPDAGSDPGAMRTRARRDGSDWVLHGPEDVDHQRVGRRRRGRLGAHRRGHPRLHRPQGHQGVHDPGHPQEAVVARLGHLRAAARRRAAARSAMLPGGQVTARPAVVPERGPLRDRLGRGGRRPRVP